MQTLLYPVDKYAEYTLLAVSNPTNPLFPQLLGTQSAAG